MAYASQTTFNQTAATPVLMVQYEKALRDMTFEAGTLFAMMPKKDDLVGSKYNLPVSYGNPTSISNTGATALTSGNMSREVAFEVDLATKYGRATVNDRTILACDGKQGAIIDAMTHQMRKVMRGMVASQSVELYRNGGGALGRISAASNVGTATITLASTRDIANFSIGQILQLSDTDGTSGAVRAGTIEIAGIDRDLGTLTATGNWTAGVAAAAANDYLFQNGSFGNAAKGLAAWIPTTAPTSTAFFGVDRTLDVTRLGGIRYAAGNKALDETIVRVAHRVADEGGRTNIVVLNPADRADLITILGSKVQYNRVESAVAGLGFKSIVLEGENVTVDVLSDRFCPQGTGYALQMDTWKILSIGKTPRILSSDGNIWRANASDMDFSVRLGSYWQLCCDAPGFNAVFSGWT